MRGVARGSPGAFVFIGGPAIKDPQRRFSPSAALGVLLSWGLVQAQGVTMEQPDNLGSAVAEFDQLLAEVGDNLDATVGALSVLLQKHSPEVSAAQMATVLDDGLARGQMSQTDLVLLASLAVTRLAMDVVREAPSWEELRSVWNEVGER